MTITKLTLIDFQPSRTNTENVNQLSCWHTIWCVSIILWFRQGVPIEQNKEELTIFW